MSALTAPALKPAQQQRSVALVAPGVVLPPRAPAARPAQPLILALPQPPLIEHSRSPLPWRRAAPLSAPAPAPSISAPEASARGERKQQPQPQQQLDFVPSTRGAAAAKPRSRTRTRAAAARPGTQQAQALPAAAEAQPALSATAAAAAAVGAAADNALQPADLVAQNTPLVHSLAWRHLYLGLSYQDLVGEGLQALESAAASYSGAAAAGGAGFGTYAAVAIARRMRRAAQEYARPVAVPPAKFALLQQERAVRQRLEAQLQRAPTREEVAGELGLPVSALQGLKNFELAFQAMDAPAGGGAGPSALSAAAADKQPALAEVAADEEQAGASGLGHVAVEATVAELLQYLPPQQRRAVELRYGLGADGRERDVAEVARALKKSVPGTRVLLGRALETLRALAD